MAFVASLRRAAAGALAGWAFIALLAAFPSECHGAEDSRLFIEGFTAFGSGDGRGAATTLSRLLEIHPDTPLRDLALFFLARAHLRAGNQLEAARTMARLLREYPGTPLAGKGEKALLELASRHRRGERLPGGEEVPGLAAVKAEEERKARERADKERLARERAVSPKVAAATVEAISPEPPVGRKGRLDVAPTEAFDFALHLEGESHAVATPVSIPFAIANRGSAADSYLLHAGLPPEFRPVFSSWKKPGTAITKTPSLAPGETFTGVLTVVVPPEGIDGQRYAFPIGAASQRNPSAAHAREIVLVASAPLLRAVLKPEKERVVPGERIEYAVTLLNVGTAAARDVTLRFIYPDEYEADRFDERLFRNEGGGVLVHGELAMEPGETRDFRVAFRVKEGAGAGQELRCRVKLLNGSLGTWDSFRSKASYVAGP